MAVNLRQGEENLRPPILRTPHITCANQQPAARSQDVSAQRLHARKPRRLSGKPPNEVLAADRRSALTASLATARLPSHPTLTQLPVLYHHPLPSSSHPRTALRPMHTRSDWRQPLNLARGPGLSRGIPEGSVLSEGESRCRRPQGVRRRPRGFDLRPLCFTVDSACDVQKNVFYRALWGR